ncbi:MAG: rRNA maturation RNase YbeY [Bacteroidota bacterium]
MTNFSESHFLEPAENVISFFVEDVQVDLPDENQLTQWIQAVVAQENAILAELNYIFCSDDYLHRINVDYLDHDTYTDIITFPYQSPPCIHGDLFISTERIAENAQSLQASFLEELLRVMIHGVLHLCGYGDKTDEAAQLMRAKENEMLDLARAKQLL